MLPSFDINAMKGQQTVHSC